MGWNVSPTIIADEVEKQAIEHAQNIALEMHRKINELSPIDTSRFVSNWFISVGHPEEYFDENRMLGRGGAFVEGGRDEVLQMKTLQDIWLQNLTPYGGDLEQGKSAQAPNGVVRVIFPAVARKWGY